MFKKILASLTGFALLAGSYQPVAAQEFNIRQLPVPGTMVEISAPFAPLAIKGLVVNPNKPLEFQFIVDTGRGPQDSAELRSESRRLVNYFLTGLTIPEGDLWVNLSPYEKDRIVPEALGQTELGRDLLAQDYVLKQLTASLIYPEKSLGQKFWNQVYSKARERFGTADMPVNTFNKVWILPAQAEVFEGRNTVYVTQSTLKVMLDEDYLASALNKNNKSATSPKGTTTAASAIVREILIPELEKEVNQGRNFAPLRQMYQALILAKWYKQTIQNRLLESVFTNQKKTSGINLDDLTLKEQIYRRYLEAYKKGVFNYVKEDGAQGNSTLRKYFSGGTTFVSYKLTAGKAANIHNDGAMVAVNILLDPRNSSDQQQTYELVRTASTYSAWESTQDIELMPVSPLTLALIGVGLLGVRPSVKMYYRSLAMKRLFSTDPGLRKKAVSHFRSHKDEIAWSKIFGRMKQETDPEMIQDLDRVQRWVEQVQNPVNMQPVIEYYVKTFLTSSNADLGEWARQKLEENLVYHMDERIFDYLRSYPYDEIQLKKAVEFVRSHYKGNVALSRLYNLIMAQPTDLAVNYYFRLDGKDSELVKRAWEHLKALRPEEENSDLNSLKEALYVQKNPLMPKAVESLRHQNNFTVIWDEADPKTGLHKYVDFKEFNETFTPSAAMISPVLLAKTITDGAIRNFGNFGSLTMLAADRLARGNLLFRDNPFSKRYYAYLVGSLDAQAIHVARKPGPEAVRAFEYLGRITNEPGIADFLLVQLNEWDGSDLERGEAIVDGLTNAKTIANFGVLFNAYLVTTQSTQWHPIKMSYLKDMYDNVDPATRKRIRTKVRDLLERTAVQLGEAAIHKQIIEAKINERERVLLGGYSEENTPEAIRLLILGRLLGSKIKFFDDLVHKEFQKVPKMPREQIMRVRQIAEHDFAMLQTEAREETTSLRELKLQGKAKLFVPANLSEKDVDSIKAGAEDYEIRGGQKASKIWVAGHWQHEDTDIETLDERLAITDAVVALATNRDPSKPIRVLDLGAGDGTGLVQLKEKLARRGITNVELFGYGDVIFKKWHQAPADITFTTDMSYFEPASMDLIYSHFGLMYMVWEPQRIEVRTLMRQLQEILTKNGILRTYPSTPTQAKLLRGHFESVTLDNKITYRPIDMAQNSPTAVDGGIDLNAIAVERRGGKKVAMRFDPAQLQELKDGFEGFTPVMMQWTPIAEPLPFLLKHSN